MRSNIMQMRNVTFCQIAALMMGLVWSSQAQATVFFNETFDDGQAAVESRWATDCLPHFLSTDALSLDTTYHVSGTTSLKEYVNGLTNRTPEFLTSNQCVIDNLAQFSTDTLWTRWYERTDAAFQYDPSNVKTVNIGDVNYYPSWWMGHFTGSLYLGTAGQVIAANYDTFNYFQNQTHVATATNTWQCVETQTVMNTPGVANGSQSIWIDGVLVMQYTGQLYRGATLQNNNSPNAHFNLFRFYAQHGVGYRWFDDFAAGDTRIGCGSIATTPPPPAPTGLVVQ